MRTRAMSTLGMGQEWIESDTRATNDDLLVGSHSSTVEVFILAPFAPSTTSSQNVRKLPYAKQSKKNQLPLCRNDSDGGTCSFPKIKPNDKLTNSKESEPFGTLRLCFPVLY